MRSNPKIGVFCDGESCKRMTEIDYPSDKDRHLYLDRELSRRNWTFYGNLDWCPDCKRDVDYSMGMVGKGEDWPC